MKKDVKKSFIFAKCSLAESMLQLLKYEETAIIVGECSNREEYFMGVHWAECEKGTWQGGLYVEVFISCPLK